MLAIDREDLITVLKMRFGMITGEMIEKIYEIDNMNTLQRLILAAANAANWKIFLEEFHSEEESFRLLGENFNPIRDWLKERDGIDGKETK
jgi:hypothetical protein